VYYFYLYTSNVLLTFLPLDRYPTKSASTSQALVYAFIQHNVVKIIPLHHTDISIVSCSIAAKCIESNFDSDSMDSSTITASPIICQNLTIFEHYKNKK